MWFKKGDSIDAVVVGVKRGSGRRSSVYGSYLLAVRPKMLQPCMYWQEFSAAQVFSKCDVEREGMFGICAASAGQATM